jgi:hypothetical protein
MSMEQHLRDVLTEQAERCLVPPPDVNGMLAGGTTRRRRSRRTTFAAAATAVLLATVGGVAALNTQMEDRSGGVTDQPADIQPADPGSDCLAPGQVPTYSTATSDRPDFIGGPVVGSQGKGPACWVVLQKYFHTILGPQTGNVWLLSDGRMISWWDSTDGLIEHRLTAEGVELVRTMVVDHLSGVRVDPWASPRYCSSARDAGSECAGTVPYQGRTHWISDYGELASRLIDLSWLPDSAFVRQEPRPYTPNWWAACYGGRHPADGETWPGEHPVDRQQVLDRLPDDAAAVLAGKDTTTVPISWTHDNGQQGGTTQYCTVVSATEHQAIGNALDHRGTAATQEEAIPLGRIDDVPAELRFRPLVPDGGIPCFCA